MLSKKDLSIFCLLYSSNFESGKVFLGISEELASPVYFKIEEKLE